MIDFCDDINDLNSPIWGVKLVALSRILSFNDKQDDLAKILLVLKLQGKEHKNVFLKAVESAEVLFPKSVI